MIVLHRLGHVNEPFHLNPDLIVTVEANPDTVITLATTAKVVVAESPQQVAQEISDFRVEVLSGALRRRRETAKGAPAAQAGSGASAARPGSPTVLSAVDGARG